MLKLDRFESVLSRTVEAVATACLLAIFALVSVLVLLRYVFNAGIVGGNEIATLLFVYAAVLGAAVEAGRHGHIAIRVLVDKLAPTKQRIAEIAGFGVVVILNVVIAWQSIGWIAITGDYLMPATQMPRLVAHFAVPLGCVLTALYSLLGIVKRLRTEGSA